MSLGSYILYLRAHKEGITPREVALELDMPEHYIHAIELEKHAGDNESRTKLAEYFGIPVEDFAEYARSTHSRFMELLKKERRPQVGFLLMNGETLAGTVDGADSSIIKIVELNSGVKTILQRHAIKKWWPLKKGSSTRDDSRSGPGNRKTFARPMGGGRPTGNRSPMGGNRAGGNNRPLGNRPGGAPNRYDRPEPGNEREPENRPRNPFAG
jgi:sRNA-binding regulator protein Hfq